MKFLLPVDCPALGKSPDDSDCSRYDECITVGEPSVSNQCGPLELFHSLMRKCQDHNTVFCKYASQLAQNQEVIVLSFHALLYLFEEIIKNYHIDQYILRFEQWKFDVM